MELWRSGSGVELQSFTVWELRSGSAVEFVSLSLVDGGASRAGEESPAGSPLKARAESSGVRAGSPNQGPASHHEGDR